MSFQVRSKDLLGRVGTIRTKSGTFNTPHMFPVLDPYHQTLDAKFFKEAGIDALMTNAYLLKRGERNPEPADVHETLGSPSGSGKICSRNVEEGFSDLRSGKPH